MLEIDQQPKDTTAYYKTPDINSARVSRALSRIRKYENIFLEYEKGTNLQVLLEFYDFRVDMLEKYIEFRKMFRVI